MDWTNISIAAGWAIILVAAGGGLTEIGPWYRNLRKPPWQPPDWLFGPAWFVNLACAATGFYLALGAAPSADVRNIVLSLFGVTLVLHALWSPLFFKWKRPDWALAENAVLWLSVAALVAGLPRLTGSSLAGWLIVPYFAWVSFAFVLNLKIVQLNGPFGSERAQA